MNTRVPTHVLESASTEQIPIPLEQLVQEAYAASAPDAQNLIIARLVGKTFETAPVATQVRLLEQLVQPVIHQAALESLRPGDVISLAQQMLQMRSDALIGLIPLLVNSAAQSGSRAASTLATLLHQRAPRRRASDRIGFGENTLCAS